MGILQPHGRHRGGDGQARLGGRTRHRRSPLHPQEGAGQAARAIVVHDLSHVRAALTAGSERRREVILLSAPGAASYAGVGWFAALLREARAAFANASHRAMLDCGDRADLVQAAMREGIAEIVFRGPARVAARLADIARVRGARIHRRRPPALDLLDERDPLAKARDWLGGHSEDTAARPTDGCKPVSRRLSNRQSKKEPAR